MTNLLHDENGQLRSGWRVCVFLFLFFFTYAVVGFLSIPYSLVFPRANYWVRMHFLTLDTTFILSASLLFGWIVAKRFEGLPFESLGARCKGKWFKHFVLGCLCGGGTLMIAVLIAFTFGGEKFELNLSHSPLNLTGSLLLTFGILAIAAASEEALFRGYVFQTLDRGGLAWLAILLTSVFFGVVHLANPNSSMISTLNTILAGVWFGLAYLKTRDLWFVWGMHLMWNWTQGSVFGIEVSGLTEITPNPLLREIDTGPTWLTGSTYGIEGGVACTFALVLSMVIIHLMLKSEPPA